ncbi:MAG: 2-isopropylmalate synthase [Candidatus Helarchaeota archaeon]
MSEKSKKIFVSPHIEKITEKLNLPDRVYIFDTTLRDGEQTHGISFTLQEKILIARQLDKIGVDIIEAGMPIVSKGDYEACKQISKLGLNAEVTGLARINRLDIDKVIECDMDSIHVFIATSDLHLKEKLKMTREEVLEAIVKETEYAKEHYSKVEFSAEDATRTDLEFLIKANVTAVEAGATRINIPDTVGTITPPGYAYIISEHKKILPSNVRISVHCHDDFGLSTANSIAGVEAGASQIHSTILGIGERAGNVSMEEVVMALYALYGIKTNIKYKYLYETAKMLERMTGFEISPNFPLVGSNAFKHESGIHAHAVIMNPRTYEPFTPELIGVPRSDKLSDILEKSIKIGKHTGGHSLGAKLEEFGFTNLTKAQFNEIRTEIKEIGDKGKQISDADLFAIATSVIGEVPDEEKTMSLEELSVMCGINVTPTATIRLKIKTDGAWVEHVGSSVGVGPVDAACSALQKVYNKFGYGVIKLKEYNLEAITGGTDALGQVKVLLEDERGELIKARAVDPDIVNASIKAMINGMNRYVAKKRIENTK